MKGPKKSCTVVRRANGELVSKTEPTPSRAPIWEKPIFRGAYTLFTAMKEACRPSTTPRPSLRTRKPMCRRPGLNLAGKEIRLGGSEQGYPEHFDCHRHCPADRPVHPAAELSRRFCAENLGCARAQCARGLRARCAVPAVHVVVSHMKDIRRTFEYHGAEHKTIFCYEAGEELTVENVRKQGKYHPRCGTSFMFVLIIIATIVSSIVFSIIDITNPFVRMLAHLILLPLVVGISYELTATPAARRVCSRVRCAGRD